MATDSNILGTDRVTQIAIVVRDIDRTAKHYANMLGIPVPPVIVTAGPEAAHTVYRGADTDATAKLCFFDLGQVSIELIEPDGKPSTWQEHLDKHGEGVHHIAFQVQGMDKRLAALGLQGMETVQRGDYEGGCYAYVDGTKQLGVELELLESFG
jgi:catechol 2,3-dioxygenase-like lactoylglutathione lyase family enzyme